MAITVTNTNNRVDDADSNSGWVSEGGGGGNPQDETDFIYQGVQSVSRKIGTSKGGFKYTAAGAAVDMTVAGDKVVMLKGVWTNAAALVAEPSAEYWIGKANHWNLYQILDDGSRGDITPLPTQLWIITPINPNVAAWIDGFTGTPTQTDVDVYVIQGDFTGSAKSENVAMDAIDISPGLFMHGTPDGTWLDFQFHDEGTIGNRFGHVVTVGQTIFLRGVFVIGRNSSGTVLEVEFTDSNRVIEFPGERVDEGETGIEIDLGNASTVVTMSAIVFTGAGRSGIKYWFDSEVEVIDPAEKILLIDHVLSTGDTMLYSAEGGTVVSGLTDDTEYFIRDMALDLFFLWPMTSGRSAAYLNGSGTIVPVSVSIGEQHSLTRAPITMPNLLVTGNSGTCTFSACTFNGFNVVTLTSGATIEDSVFNLVHLIDMADNASLDRTTINGQMTTEGVAVVQTPSPDDIIDCIFNASIQGGHAVEVESTGTYDWNGNKTVGYGPNPAEFDGVSDVNTGTEHITLSSGHGYVTGDAVYYNDRGNTQLTGLVDQTRYYINVDGNSVSLHVTKSAANANLRLVNITATQTGTHALESANAVIFNSSGGALTLDVINGGSVPTIRNSAGSSTTVNNSVTVLVQGVTEGTSIKVIANETVGTVTIGDVLFEGFADNNGEASYSQNYESAFDPSGLDIIVRARSSGIATAAQQDDNGVFTDETAEANTATANDMNLMPATPVANQDAYLFGHDEEFNQLKLDISTLATGGTVTWQYRKNDDTWAALSGVTDGTNSFANSGANIVSFTQPSDWKAETFGGLGPFKYIRALFTAGTFSVQPQGRKVTLDVTRYLPFNQNNTILSTGLTVTASWVVDSIATFG